MVQTTFWTQDRIDTLKTRRAEGVSGSAIGALLGCSRDAVFGKAHRLKLPPASGSGRPVTAATAPVRRKRKLKREHLTVAAPAPTPRPLVDPPPVTAEPPSRNIALVDVKSGECRWIAGHDGRCCGHATARSLPYCGFHSARASRGSGDPGATGAGGA